MDQVQAPALVRTRLSVMMFLEFFLWGAWYVSMGPYLFANDMGGVVGWAYSVGPIAAIVSPFFLGIIADRFFATERVLGVMQILGGVALCAAPWAASQSANMFIVAILLHMLCYMPTLGLTNTLAFHNMTNAQKQFPLIRVWGTIGWIVANFVISNRGWDISPNMFYLAGGSALVMGLFSFTLPHTPPPSFLICIPLAAYYALAGQFVGEVGFDKIAQTMSYGQMSEIVFMLVMPLFFARLGVKWMLLVGMGAWVVRYGLFAGAADENIKWMVLTGVILHGICYDFFFVTGQIYVDNVSSAKIRGQAQGFLVLITQGLGMFVGAQIIGRLVAMNTTGEGNASVIDWQSVWIVPCIFAGVIMVIFFLFFRDPGRKPKLDAPVVDEMDERTTM